MGELIEIRWHGRGGQGVVTAGALLAEAVLTEGKHFQSFPEYGPERMGAPIQAFSRVSTEPINLRCGITNPDIVIVLDPTLIGVIDVAEGLEGDGVIIVNTNESPEAVRKRLGILGRKIFTVDATTISLETIGKPIPNTPMMGALLKATGILSLENVVNHLSESFSKKFSAEIVEGNIKAVERAYEEVKSE